MFGPHRHAYLLGTLLLMLLVSPFLRERIAGIPVLEILLFVTLVSSVLAAAVRRRQRLIGFTLVGNAQLAALAQHGGSEPTLAALRPLLGLTFFAYVATLLLRRIFVETSRVTIETICAALAVYLFLGLIWVFAYSLLEIVEPGSFSVGAGDTGGSPFSRFIGFSFVTLTTLGYGNISPMNPRADALAYTEAIIGQIYLTVLVARLVAMELLHSQRKHISIE